jgi:hypothetical protein
MEGCLRSRVRLLVRRVGRWERWGGRVVGSFTVGGV